MLEGSEEYWDNFMADIKLWNKSKKKNGGKHRGNFIFDKKAQTYAPSSDKQPTLTDKTKSKRTVV